MSARSVDRSVAVPMGTISMADGAAIRVPIDVPLTIAHRAGEGAMEQARIEDHVEQNARAAIAAGRCPGCGGRLDIPARMPEYSGGRVCRGCGSRHSVGRQDKPYNV